MPRSSEQSRGVVAISVAVGIFSWGFIIAKALGLPAPVIATWRLLIGTVFLVTVAKLARIRWPDDWRAGVAAGIAFGVHQLLYISAAQQTSIAIVSLIGAMKPLVVTLAARRAVGEEVAPSFRIWSVLALGGVGLVVGANYHDQSRTLLGDGLAVLNLFAVTAFLLFSKRGRREGAPTVTFTALTLGTAMLVVAPGLLFVDTAIPTEGWQWGLIAVLALVPGNGHLLVNWAHRRVTAALAALVLSGVPLLASVWAHLVLDEPFGLLHVAGALLVIAAIEGGRRAEARFAASQETVSP